MRDIRFRAYWKLVNEMRYFIPGSFQDTSDGWAMTFILSKENIDEHIFIGEAGIMQYTGQKDKNGKEIYEGDICRFSFHNMEKTGVVTYKPELLKYVFQIDVGEWSEANYMNNIEVIGNIHQHPHLLSETPITDLLTS